MMVFNPGKPVHVLCFRMEYPRFAKLRLLSQQMHQAIDRARIARAKGDFRAHQLHTLHWEDLALERACLEVSAEH
jgi:hypothetical protein